MRGSQSCGQLDELEALGDDLALPVVELARVLDRVLEVDERAGLLALVGVGDEDRALLEQRPVALEHEVDRRVEERVPGASSCACGWPVGATSSFSKVTRS